MALRVRGLVRETTLVGPWGWVVTSLLCIAAADVAEVLFATSTFFLQLAATSTFCPVIALLGAKRPQDRGWHFVVLSLWVVLMLPALEAALLAPGQLPDTRGLRAVFVYGLIVLGLVNGVATRFWVSSLLVAAAQVIYWRASEPSHFAVPTVIGTAAYTTAIAWAWWRANRAGPTRSPYDRVWCDFRDAYGLLWGLRVAEQINATADRLGWELRLTWKGFVNLDGTPVSESVPPATDEQLRQLLVNLLRRFVTAGWIAERLPPGVH